MTKDLIEVADVDFKNVNVWSIMAVAVIILISFRSLSIPVLLVASIEAAISINMGIPYFTGTQLPSSPASSSVPSSWARLWTTPS